MSKKKKINTRNTPIRERIVETATRLFFENGIQAVGVDKIVAEARIAKMTLYSYFASKDDLVIEYLEKSADAWIENFHNHLNQVSKTDEDRIVNTFIYLKENFNNSTAYRGNGFINAATELSDGKNPAHGIILNYQDNLRGCFESWAYNSGLKDARELSYALLNLFNGAVVSTQIEDFPEPLTHTINLAKKLIELHR
ncbi:MAG: TetR/AcrR family transcriptional regulator [Lentisphaeraceae bacterium]|nr:TetR/AcrR family transcriptional regulator [Lentisphaeraceae bacterium]